MFNRTSVQEQLRKVQKGCRSRLLTIEDIESFKVKAEAWLEEHETPAYALGYITFEHIECVPNSYRQVGHSTQVKFTFTQKGTVKATLLERAIAPAIPYGGRRTRLLLAFWTMVDDLYQFRPMNSPQNLMLNRIAGSLGFNHQGSVHI